MATNSEFWQEVPRRHLDDRVLNVAITVLVVVLLAVVVFLVL